MYNIKRNKCIKTLTYCEALQQGILEIPAKSSMHLRSIQSLNVSIKQLDSKGPKVGAKKLCLRRFWQNCNIHRWASGVEMSKVGSI